MRLLIVGSRKIEKFDLNGFISPNVDIIISGGAVGVDSIAEKYADDHKLSKLIIRPRYDIYGRCAPIKRNEEMVELADEVLVIWDGHSRGTKSTIDFAKKKNKKLRVIIPE